MILLPQLKLFKRPIHIKQFLSYFLDLIFKEISLCSVNIDSVVFSFVSRCLCVDFVLFSCSVLFALFPISMFCFSLLYFYPFKSVVVFGFYMCMEDFNNKYNNIYGYLQYGLGNKRFATFKESYDYKRILLLIINFDFDSMLSFLDTYLSSDRHDMLPDKLMDEKLIIKWTSYILEW